jgi:hypothetical protein
VGVRWRERSIRWRRVDKAFPSARVMADKHYTRQTIGNRQWTRPGYNLVLYKEYRRGRALFCWWRPKWESGIVGTERKDGLRVVECTMFRREGRTPLASSLIRSAVEVLSTVEGFLDLHMEDAGKIDWLITGVGSEQTRGRRSKRARPGACFIHAGWEEFEHRFGKADVWLRRKWGNPWAS